MRDRDRKSVKERGEREGKEREKEKEKGAERESERHEWGRRSVYTLTERLFRNYSPVLERKSRETIEALSK